MYCFPTNVKENAIYIQHMNLGEQSLESRLCVLTLRIPHVSYEVENFY